MDLMQDDLSHLDWTSRANDNLNRDEIQALRELKEGPKVIIKKVKRGEMLYSCWKQSMKMKSKDNSMINLHTRNWAIIHFPTSYKNSTIS